MKKKNFITNIFGLHIKRCCASCQQRVLTEPRGCRICGRRGERVPASYCCGEWELNERLAKAGKQLGSVKKYDYLMYVFAEQKAGSEASVSQLREKYEKINGTIYYNV